MKPEVGHDIPELIGPNTDHSPQRNEYSDYICNDKLDQNKLMSRISYSLSWKTDHLLRADFPVSLNVPEPKCTTYICEHTRIRLGTMEQYLMVEVTA